MRVRLISCIGYYKPTPFIKRLLSRLKPFSKRERQIWFEMQHLDREGVFDSERDSLVVFLRELTKYEPRDLIIIYTSSEVTNDYIKRELDLESEKININIVSLEGKRGYKDKYESILPQLLVIGTHYYNYLTSCSLYSVAEEQGKFSREI